MKIFFYVVLFAFSTCVQASFCDFLSALIKENVENKLIKQVNDELFFGRKEGSLYVKLRDLRKYRDSNKSREELNQSEELYYKIKHQRMAVCNRIEDSKLKNELLDPKREVFMLLHNKNPKLPDVLVRDILTEWLPSSFSELITLQDRQYVRKDGTEKRENRLDMLRRRRKQGDKEWNRFHRN